VRGTLKNVAFTIVVWAALFALVEGVLRGWEAARPRGREWTDGQLFMCEPDARRIWHYKAGYRQTYRTPEFTMAVRTNGLRLRGAEWDAAALAPGTLRVLALGDSFTFGWGVSEEERFSDRLQAALAAPGRPVVVVNAGHWSYTVDQELILLRELVPRLRPHLVVQGLYPPGVVAILAHQWERDGHGRLTACRNAGIRVDDEGALRFTNDYLERTPFRSRVVSGVFRIWFNWRLSREAMVGDMALLNPAVTRYEPAWRMTSEVIEETGRYLRDEGVDWIAFSVPRDLQVSEAEWNDTYRKAASGVTLDPDLPMRRFGASVAAGGGEWVDLLPAFRSRYAPNLYFGVDPHWTAEGHRLAAEELRPAVAGRLGHLTAVR
jgi:hypothetical protein